VAYKKNTPFFGIPYPSTGEIPSGAEEKKAAMVIESALLAASNGVVSCVFEEGQFAIEANDDNTYDVVLMPSSGKPALTGALHNRWVYADHEIRWEGLKSRKFWLHIAWRPGMYADPDGFRTLSSRRSISKPKFLLLATADFTSEEPTLNVYPDGKVYANDVVQHVSDDTNPHGRSLIQDYLMVLKGLDIEITDDFEDGAAITVDDNRKESHPTVEVKKGDMILKDENTEAKLSDLVLRTAIVDCRSGGPEGVTVDAEFAIQFAQVSRRLGRGKRELGEVFVGYCGEDTKLRNNDHKVCLYNTGHKGLPIRVLLVGS